MKSQDNASTKAGTPSSTEKKLAHRPRADTTTADSSTKASTSSKHTPKAESPSKALEFDIEHRGFDSKGYLQKLALRRAKFKKVKAAKCKMASAGQTSSPLKQKMMMTGGSSSKKHSSSSKKHSTSSKKHSSASTLSNLLPATLRGDGLYVSTLIDLGTPETTLTTHRVGVDSGAWGLWVGPKYLEKRSPQLLNQNKVVAEMEPTNYNHGDIMLEQELYRDTLTIAGMVVNDQEFGVVKDIPDKNDEESMEFSEGGMGILSSPPDFDEVKEFMESGEIVERPIVSIIDNLFLQKKIRKKILFLCMEPWNTREKDTSKKLRTKGKLWFGELSKDQKKGLKFTSCSESESCADDSTLDLTIKDGDTKLLSKKCGMIDSGAPRIYLGKKAFRAYFSKFGLKESASDLDYCIPEKAFKKLNPLVLSYKDESSHSVTLSLSPFAQVVPPTLNELLGVPKGYLKLMVADLDDEDDDDIAFILGSPFCTCHELSNLSF